MAAKDEKGNIGRVVAILSGLGSFLMSIIAVIGVVVYQTNSNTELKTEVRYVKDAIPEIRNDIKNELAGLKAELSQSRKDINEELAQRLKTQDDKIEALRQKVGELEIKVRVLEGK